MKTAMAPHTAPLHMVSSGSVMKNDRRASKPLMEKRRRERINKSLNELKSILLNALRKDQSTCHSKLEKADILEMTVRYLRTIQRQRVTAAMAIDPNVINKYRNGYTECKNEVSHFLEAPAENVHPEVKARLMNHLGNNVPPQTSSPMPPHMMAQAPRGAPLLTSMPPVPAGSTMSPLQIRMAPNTQIQQAMAVAAAMAQSRSLMQQQQMVPFVMREQMYSSASDDRSLTPSSSAAGSPLPRHASPKVDVKPRHHHVRHNSGSSYGSSGFASPGSPVSLTSSTSPKKPAVRAESPQQTVQGSFVLFPQSSAQACAPVTMETEQSSDEGIRRSASPVSSVSSPAPCSSRDGERVTSRPRNTASPASSVSSVDSEPVWRPW